jgi:S-adenosylmethionine-diacylglycerol 3-amino-3-carboxypropyl transferase
MSTLEAYEPIDISRQRSSELVGAAILRNKALSRAGLNERAFTLAFSNLVYPQIWEDPVVDMEALAIEPHHRILAIASGGCNLLSYLTTDPREIIGVDLNTAHIALNRLKIAAAKYLPTYEDFFRFFGTANSAENVKIFDALLCERLDKAARSYWEDRNWRGERRIECFARGFYSYGLLGRFISAGHRLAKLYGKDPRRMMQAKSREEQIRIYESELKDLFEKRFIRFLLEQRSSLFGLGIPPAQYDELSGGRPMHEVIEERLRRLACGFDLKENYFAWQAFNRGYAADGGGPLPPYLERANFDKIRLRAGRIHLVNQSLTDYLATEPAAALDRYVLLDAQDWMSAAEITALWSEIVRTARPGARVIFRTAGLETILPGRVPEPLLSRWRYEREFSRVSTANDRSAIYGGFHLYILEG